MWRWREDNGAAVRHVPTKSCSELWERHDDSGVKWAVPCGIPTVLWWWDISALSVSMLAQGTLNFLCVSRILCWVRCSLLMDTAPCSSVGQVSISSTGCPAGHLLQCRAGTHCSSPSPAPPASAAPGHSTQQGQELLALPSHSSWAALPPSCLLPSSRWDLPVSVHEDKSHGRYCNEFTGNTAWSLSTVPLAEIKQGSPRYLLSNLLFQSRRENYRPLITQGEEHTAPILVISSTTIKHFRKRAWKPEIVGLGSFCLVPSLITHKRNKWRLIMMLPFASKSVCPIWDQELGLLGRKMLSLG